MYEKVSCKLDPLYKRERERGTRAEASYKLHLGSLHPKISPLSPLRCLLRASILIVGVAMLLTSYGCMSATPPQPDIEHPAAKTYKSFVNLSVSTVKKALDVIDKYTLMSKDPHFKSLANNGAVDIRDLASYLDSRGGEKLLTLKRMKVMEDGSQIEVSLGEELSNIVNEFQEEVEKIAPDPTPALSLPGVSTNEEGNIVIGGDMVIDRKTLGGAITTEILNAQARGEDVEEVLKALSDAGEEVCKELGADIVSNDGGNNVDIRDTVSPQYLYKVDTPRWNKGIIPYKFDSNVPQWLRDLVRMGMDEWEKASEGKVKFIYDDSGWTDFLTSIGAYRKLAIKVDNPNSVVGVAQAEVGSFSYWRSHIKFKEGANIDLSTVLHELGHTLGLEHEHQREDRDDYITVEIEDNDKSWTFEKIPFKTGGLIQSLWRSIIFVANHITVGFGPWKTTIVIYLPVIQWLTIYHWIWNENAKASSEYDYFSIMHYANGGWAKIKSKKGCTNIWTNWDGIVITNIITNGQPIPRNANISRLDAEGVKELYK